MAEALLEAYPQLRCVGIDADPEACARASARLSMFSDRLLVLNAYYDDALADLKSSTSTEKILGSAFWNGFDGVGQSEGFLYFV